MNTQRSLTKYFIGLTAVTIGILLIPFIAMQFTHEVDWTFSDFVIFGGMIVGVGSAYALITRKFYNFYYRIATGSSLLSVFLMLWANGAVGIIGSENDAINLGYFAVLGVGLIGAAISGFKPLGLSYTLFTMAFMIVGIGIAALFIGMQDLPYSSVIEILGVTAFFTVLYVFSGLLYRHALLEMRDSEEA